MIDRNWPSIHGFRANQVNCCIALNWTEVKWKVITRGRLIKLRVVSPKYSIRNRFPSSSRNRRENDFQANIPFVLPPIKSSADMLMHYRGGFDGCAKVVLQSISPQPQHSDPLQFIVLLPGSVTAPIIPHNNSICYLLRLLSSWWCSRGERQKTAFATNYLCKSRRRRQGRLRFCSRETETNGRCVAGQSVLQICNINLDGRWTITTSEWWLMGYGTE